MMKLWKGKKGSPSKEEPQKTGEGMSKESSSDMQLSISDIWTTPVASAPPPSEIKGVLNWAVNLELKISSRMPIETGTRLIDMLSLITDHYEGPVVLKPVVMLLYATTGVTIRDMVRSGNHYVYASGVDSVLECNVTSELYENETCDVDWYKSYGVGANQFKIQFKLLMTPTKRRGTNIFKIYTSQASKFGIPPLEMLIEALSIDRVMIEGDTVLFS